jgi:putative transcriptional regulator
MGGLFKLAYLSYVETAKKIDLDAVDKLCELFNCEVGDLFERV